MKPRSLQKHLKRCPPPAPGQIRVGKIGDTVKPRPWLVLWIDEDCAALALCSTQKHFPYTIPLPTEEFVCVGSYVVLMPLGVVREGTYYSGTKIGSEDRRRIRAQLQRNLDLEN